MLTKFAESKRKTPCRVTVYDGFGIGAERIDVLCDAFRTIFEAEDYVEKLQAVRPELNYKITREVVK